MSREEMINFIVESVTSFEGLTEEESENLRSSLTQKTDTELEKDVAFYDELWNK